MKPILKLVGVCREGKAAAQAQCGQIAFLCQLLLLLGQRLLLCHELQFVEVGVESCKRGVVYFVNRLFLNPQLLFCRVVHHVFQHVILLYEHRLRIGKLYVHVFNLHVYSLEVNLKCHSVVVEGLCYFTQLLETLDVVVDDGYLLGGVLYQIIHFAYLNNQVLTRLLIRQLVELVECFGNVNGGKCRLAVQRHLQLQSRRRVVLQRLGDVVGLAVSRSVGHRHRWVEVVVE